MKAFLWALPLMCLACSPSTTTKPMPMKPTDPHSFGNSNQVKPTHLHWLANIQFESKTIQAVAEWSLEYEAADTLVLDSYELLIDRVEGEDGQNLAFVLGQHDPILGAPLKIALENNRKVRIFYRTPANARALQWTEASQTEGKTHPFLYTQSQAILARTWVPCMDSPGLRFTYSAKVKAPEGMMVLMSAENPQALSADDTYSFQMPQPIPSYLLALACGKLEFQAIGERTGVYAEPQTLEAAAYEFAEMETMLTAAENLYGPYAWGRYDLIVLPPSFPFGGMENPRLTFATPTIMAGDRSLVSLVAHELAHSWSGNLVTNASWSDFWLNEGFTVYFENRIMEAVYGRDYAEMLAALSQDELREEVEAFMKTAPKDTRLKLELKGRNPDDGVTAIAYDKGYFFLRLLEETVGRETFDAFLKQYFNEYAFQVMNTERFLDIVKSRLLSAEQWEKLMVNRWVYEDGLPENMPKVEAERFVTVDHWAGQFAQMQTLPKQEVYKNWSTHEWLRYMRLLPETLSGQQLESLDATFAFTQSQNSEISAQWLKMYVSQSKSALPEPIQNKLKTFLESVGRRKFLVPVYKALLDGGHSALALKLYEAYRNNYHAVARETLDKLLKEA